MKCLMVGVVILLAACGSATAPNANPCAQNEATIQRDDGKPVTITQPSLTSVEWGYPNGDTDPSHTSLGAFTVTFDWSTGSCVVTFGP